MKRIIAKEDVCIGCRLCEVWCQVQHSKSKDIIKAFKKEGDSAGPRLHVEEQEASSFAIQCRNCEHPDCVYSCISGAMYIDEETETIQHDPEKCVGCWTCIMACHRGAILRDERARRIASKCDMCVGLEVPACVANCPNEALILQEEDDE